jgi:hypothetical protein
MHKFIGGWNLLITGFSIILCYVHLVAGYYPRATFEDTYYNSSKGLRLGMILFIVSE